MIMNKKQRIVLYVCAALIALMLLFPPFRAGRSVGRGYSFLLSPPSYSSVNVEMLAIQWVAVLLVGGLLWFAMKDKA
jgi:hypothetical protein